MWILRVDPENERPQHADAVTANPRHILAIVVRAATLRHTVLTDQRERRLVGTLQADKDACTPGGSGGLRQLVVVAEVDGDLRDPLLVEFGVLHRSEQVQAPLLRLPRESIQVVVDEDDVSSRNGSQFRDDVIDRSHAEEATIEDGHRAEGAIHGTAPGGLRRDVLVGVLLENAAIGLHDRLSTSSAVVARLQAPSLDVRDNRGPQLLTLADEERVCVLCRFLLHQRRMNAAHDHRNASRAELRGDGVGAWRLRRERGNANEVGFDS